MIHTRAARFSARRANAAPFFTRVTSGREIATAGRAQGAVFSKRPQTAPDRHSARIGRARASSSSNPTGVFRRVRESPRGLPTRHAGASRPFSAQTRIITRAAGGPRCRWGPGEDEHDLWTGASTDPLDVQRVRGDERAGARPAAARRRAASALTNVAFLRDGRRLLRPPRGAPCRGTHGPPPDSSTARLGSAAMHLPR